MSTDFGCFFDKCMVIFVTFGAGVPRRASLTAGLNPRQLRDDFGTIFDGVWPPFGEPRAPLRGSFGARISNLERLRRFCCDFLGASKKGPKNYQKSHEKGAQV